MKLNVFFGNLESDVPSGKYLQEEFFLPFHCSSTISSPAKK